MIKRIHSDRVLSAVVLFFILVAVSFLFAVIYRVGENILVTGYIENMEESANKLGDNIAGSFDTGIGAVLDYYGRHVETGFASGFPGGQKVLEDLFYPVMIVEINDSRGNLRDRWVSRKMDELLREGLPDGFMVDRHLQEALPLAGKIFIPFDRNLEGESGEMKILGMAVLNGAAFLSSLKLNPDAMLLIREDRFYPVFGAPGRTGCLECHLDGQHREVFPIPHGGFVEERGLFLSARVQGHRYVIAPVPLGGDSESYFFTRFPSEETIGSLGAFRRLIVPTWLLLSVIITLGTVILYRRLREPAPVMKTEELPHSDDGYLSLRGMREDQLFPGYERKETVVQSEEPGVVGSRRGARSPDGGAEGNGKGREGTLATIKEVSEFLASVNRITYPERLGETIVWNLMNLIPGDLIILAVMGPEGPEGDFEVFSAQRFRKDSVSDIFLKKLNREFPSYVKSIIHARAVDVEEDPFLSRYSIYKHGLKKVLIFPIEVRGVILGVLSVFRKSRIPFSSYETEMASLVTGHLGTVIENAKLHEEVKSNYFNTLKAIVNSLEARDRYRKGHSERVTDIALAIGDKVGLTKRRRNILFQAAVLHDIGKITIDPSVLNKRGKLSADEISLIRQHPLIGYRIIEPLSFLREVKACISEHHERYDGGGYPSGTKKDDLTLEGRILSVADAFDSMTSERPYRKAMTDQEAIDELKRNAGEQFDPQVVKLFLEVYREREIRRFKLISGRKSS